MYFLNSYTSWALMQKFIMVFESYWTVLKRFCLWVFPDFCNKMNISHVCTLPFFWIIIKWHDGHWSKWKKFLGSHSCRPNLFRVGGVTMDATSSVLLSSLLLSILQHFVASFLRFCIPLSVSLFLRCDRVLVTLIGLKERKIALFWYRESIDFINMSNVMDMYFPVKTGLNAILKLLWIVTSWFVNLLIIFYKKKLCSKLQIAKMLYVN